VERPPGGFLRDLCISGMATLSSRDKLEVWLPCTGPYPSWGAAGPVGGALGGLGRARRVLVYAAYTSQGRGLSSLVVLFDETLVEIKEAGGGEVEQPFPSALGSACRLCCHPRHSCLGSLRFCGLGR